jgi:glucose/mannose-6-phosphate isomerase
VAVTSADPLGMDGAIASLAAQLRLGERVGAEAGREVKLPGAVVIAAMGGSAMGGELLRALVAGECPVPITRVRGFRIPHWAGPGTLVMCVSYSGETEETLACARQARSQGAGILIVGSGGTLISLAREWGVACAHVPNGVATGQPRAALGYLFGAMAGAFGASGLASSGIASQAAEGVEAVDRAAARDLGERLAPTVPLIYGAGPIGAVAYRWKTQLNENAKMHAFSHALPELAHNEIVGWEGAGMGRFAAVLLSDPGQDPAVRRSIEATAALVAADAELVQVVEGRGPTPAARAFSLVAHGDWVSYYAALARGVDPTPVQNIDVLKRALKS